MDQSEEKLLVVNVGGMSCNHCEMTIESALKKEIENIIYVKANKEKNIVNINYTDKINIENIKSVIEENGFKILE